MSKNIFLLTLLLFSLISLCISELSEYEKIVLKAKEMKNAKGNDDEYKEEVLKTEFKDKKATSPITIGNFYCDPSIKINTIRQDVMTNDNYNLIMYRYKYFLLYVTASWCDYCCQHEKELLGVKQTLLETTFEGEEIPIVQIQSDTDLEALKDLKIGFFKVPSLYFVKDKEFIQYNSFFKSDNIIRFINNILNPVVTLHSIQDVERFIDTSKNFEEKNDFLGNTVLNIPEATDHHLRNRIIGFFSDLEDYSAEYSVFLSLAEKISHRPDLRIGIVTDKEIVRHFKQVYDGIWFNSHSWNSVVLKRDDTYHFLDLSLLNDQLEVFMLYNSISFVDELSNNNTVLTSKIATPIALFFIDSVFILPNFHAQLKFLIDIAKPYVSKYVFMFMDGNVRSTSKEQLGLKKDSK
jgi:hypothetical protein